ncbi:MAG: TetR/AcrR family transcriptional regulator [Salinivirgaceae bacterium]|nr:TetR/AcrR family transcriptional regulator [Salinivirgaceae bacterium]
MALQTFLNLKDERQEEILEICYKEFALKGYDSASLSDIVKTCALAKGSFYRYFASKKELYTFLLEKAKNKRLSNLHELILNPEIDFFELIKLNFLEKVQFDLDFPSIGGFLYKVMHEKDNNEIADIIQHLYDSVLMQTKQIITIDKYRNQLLDLDLDMMTFQIFHMQLWLYDYVAKKFNLNYEENIKSGKPILNISKTDLENIINQSVSMLKSGISK